MLLLLDILFQTSWPASAVRSITINECHAALFNITEPRKGWLGGYVPIGVLRFRTFASMPILEQAIFLDVMPLLSRSCAPIARS